MSDVMMALVYRGPGDKAWEQVPKPVETADTDAIVRVDVTTICGTDLHIDTFSIPVLVRLLRGHQVHTSQFATHHLPIEQIEEAYDTFSRAGETGALKVVLSRT